MVRPLLAVAGAQNFFPLPVSFASSSAAGGFSAGFGGGFGGYGGHPIVPPKIRKDFLENWIFQDFEKY